MIVVMPYGRPGPSATLRFACPRPRGRARRDPSRTMWWKTWFPSPKRPTAFQRKPTTAPSLGSRWVAIQTLQVGLTHLDTFHYIGAFSPVVMNPEQSLQGRSGRSHGNQPKAQALLHLYRKTGYALRIQPGFRQDPGSTPGQAQLHRDGRMARMAELEGRPGGFHPSPVSLN